MKILKYLKSVIHFFDLAILLYFPKTFDEYSKQKASQNNGMMNGTQGGLQSNLNQPYVNSNFVPGILPQTSQMKQGGKDNTGGPGMSIDL